MLQSFVANALQESLHPPLNRLQGFVCRDALPCARQEENLLHLLIGDFPAQARENRAGGQDEYSVWTDDGGTRGLASP